MDGLNRWLPEDSRSASGESLGSITQGANRLKRLLSAALVLCIFFAVRLPAPAAPTPQPSSSPDVVMPNDPKQNWLQASGVIKSDLHDALQASIHLHVSVSNPTMEMVNFTFAKAIFVQGSLQKGHPLFADVISPAPLNPGSVTRLRFVYNNPKDVTLVSAYVLLGYTFEGRARRTALFVSGPQQTSIGDRWQQKFFPYGHYTGFFSTTDYVMAPYWGGWYDFGPYWW